VAKRGLLRPLGWSRSWHAVFLAVSLPSAATADEMKIDLCHAGIVDLLSFPEHVNKLRGLTR
jgi:hypothetical protein